MNTSEADDLQPFAPFTVAQSHQRGATDPESLETLAWALWPNNPGEWRPRKAVSQLLFAQLKANPTEGGGVHSCLAPIRLLEPLESQPGSVFATVVASFKSYVGERPA